jgi:hypothetical protein
MVIDRAAGARPLERRANQERSLDRLRDDDGFSCYVRILF